MFWRFVQFIALVLPAVCGFTHAAQGEQANDAHQQLARQAHQILKTNCQQCHWVEKQVPGFDILDRELLVQSRPNERSYIQPGKPLESEIWQRLVTRNTKQRMPPDYADRHPTAAELETIEQWIKAGAPFPISDSRPHRNWKYALEHVRNHLRDKVAVERRSRQRYFTLIDLNNNTNVSDADLRIYRAAFVKLVNSLNRGETVIPPLVDEDESQLIFTLNMDDVGWPAVAWSQLCADYPYGLIYHDEVLQRLNDEIKTLTGEIDFDEFPFMRVDWFVANASQPPHYHELLKLPPTLVQLQAELGVAPHTAKRAGFAGSGISRHNRVIDQMSVAKAEYYYRSYDFDRSFGRAVVFRFPLSADVEDEQLRKHAFEEAGGEVVWGMKNGMQAYFLADRDGNRLDTAPIRIVRDPSEAGGTPAVVNGISCIGCHRQGLQPYEDAVRRTLIGDEKLRDAIQTLYEEPAVMSAIVNKHRDVFIAAVEALIGPYLLAGDDADRHVWDFPEPVSQVARWHQKDVTLQEAACELGFLNPEELRDEIVRGENRRQLQGLGMGPLAQDRGVPRAMWATREESDTSVFQQSARILRKGAPSN